jgi:hypothetical protein
MGDTTPGTSCPRSPQLAKPHGAGPEARFLVGAGGDRAGTASSSPRTVAHPRPSIAKFRPARSGTSPNPCALAPPPSCPPRLSPRSVKRHEAAGADPLRGDETAAWIPRTPPHRVPSGGARPPGASGGENANPGQVAGAGPPPPRAPVVKHAIRPDDAPEPALPRDAPTRTPAVPARSEKPADEWVDSRPQATPAPPRCPGRDAMG